MWLVQWTIATSMPISFVLSDSDRRLSNQCWVEWHQIQRSTAKYAEAGVWSVCLWLQSLGKLATLDLSTFSGMVNLIQVSLCNSRLSLKDTLPASAASVWEHGDSAWCECDDDCMIDDRSPVKMSATAAAPAATAASPAATANCVSDRTSSASPVSLSHVSHYY